MRFDEAQNKITVPGVVNKAAGNLTLTAGALTLNCAGDITIGAALTATAINLNTAVTITGAGVLTTTSIVTARGASGAGNAGSLNLSGTHAVGTLNGLTGGLVSFTNGAGLTVANASGTTVGVTRTAGALNIVGPVSGSGNVTVTSQGALGSITQGLGGTSTASGPITISADTMSIAATVEAGTGGLVVLQRQNPGSLSIGPGGDTVLVAADLQTYVRAASRNALRNEAFAAAQLVRRSETARFLAQSSARLASSGGNEQVANSVRRREELDLKIPSLLSERDALLASGRNVTDLDPRITERRVARLELSEAQAGQLVRSIRGSLDAGPQGNGGPPPFNVAAAAELYDRLLRPLEASFQGTDSLVIVPDGPLLALPFGLLLTSASDGSNLAGAPWLIRRQAIVHTPSVQALVTQRARAPSSNAPLPYIGFGDFIPATGAQLARSFPRDRCGNVAQQAALLGRLPGFTREIRLAAAEMGRGSQQRMGREFTAEAVSQARLDQFRVVHFATHGLLPNDLSCLTDPAITVSNLPGDADASRAFLNSSAIMRLRMDADLVILSACNTAGPAGGSDQSAEALSGLARAFFVAGARGLLATHWLANDVAATVLMTRMLAIQSGREPGTSNLSSAQSAYSCWSAPRGWSMFRS